MLQILGKRGKEGREEIKQSRKVNGGHLQGLKIHPRGKLYRRDPLPREKRSRKELRKAIAQGSKYPFGIFKPRSRVLLPSLGEDQN